MSTLNRRLVQAKPHKRKVIKMDNELLQLQEYLFQTYPEDQNIKHFFSTYEAKVKQQQQQQQQQSFQSKRPVLKRTRSVVKQEIKEKMIDSYSEERYMTGEIDLDLDTEKKCIDTLLELEKSIRSSKRDIIYKTAMQGQVIKKLKEQRKGNVGVFLTQNGIKFSTSHCYALIRLYKLCQKHPNLLKCALHVKFVIGNMKTIEDICEEMRW